MLVKHCDLCGKSFTYYNDEDKYLRQNFLESTKKSNIVSNIGNDRFCQNCVVELENSALYNTNQEITIKTIHGIMRLTMKKKKTSFLIRAYNKNYRYPLLSENIEYENEANLKFIQYYIKLKHNQFKIIRNIEALDENYRRVFSRVKYSILF